MRKPKIDIVLFEAACKDVRRQFYSAKYNFTGKNACPVHQLKLPFQRLAFRYLPSHKMGYNKVVFPAEMVQFLARELGVYVTDIIRIK